MKIRCLFLGLLILACSTPNSYNPKFSSYQQLIDSAFSKNSKNIKPLLDQQELTIVNPNEHTCFLQNKLEVAINDKNVADLDALLNQIDSLRIMSPATPFEQARYFLQKGKIADLQMNDSAEHFYQKALNLYTEIEDSNQIGVAKGLIWRHLIIKGDQNVILDIEKAINDRSFSQYPRIVAHFQRLAGFFYFFKNDFDQSLKFYLLALPHFITEENIPLVSEAQTAIGIIYRSQDRHVQAKEYFWEAYEQSISIKDSTQALTALTNYAISLSRDSSQIKRVDSIYEVCYDFCKRRENYSGLVSLCINRASQLMYQKDEIITKTEALSLIKEAFSIDSALNNIHGICYDYAALGGYYYTTKEYKKALKFYNIGASMADSLKNYDLLNDIYDNIQQIQLLQNDFKGAAHTASQMNVVQDSLFNRDVIQKEMESWRAYERELADKDQEILELQIQNAEHKNQKKNLFILLIAMILIVAIWRLIRSFKRRKHIERKLIRTKTRLSQEVKSKAELEAALVKSNAVIKAKNILINSLRNDEALISRITKDINTDSDWLQFFAEFELLYPGFLDNIKNKYPKITNQDLRVSCLIKQKLSLKEMAEILNLSVDGVKKAKQRLKSRTSAEFISSI
ncbi:MAG: hypothetical protein MRY83_02615 [Flavobacteriales bacterium]|nr:hypothetical protein [Flavobacteriales bacterium]